jgi:hypothetical protein
MFVTFRVEFPDGKLDAASIAGKSAQRMPFVLGSD